MRNLLKKLVSAGDSRTSRLHTEDNVFIGWGRVFREVPIVLLQKISNRMSGARSVAPWWPIPAIEAVESKLRPDMVVIEFGSGSSTIWIARRTKKVLAREHDAEWANITRRRIVDEGLSNCEVQHCEGESYYTFDSDQKFDFAVVDGEFRWKCLESLSTRMNPGGLIYFDNSDSDKDAKHYSDFDLSGSRYAQSAVAKLKESHDVEVEKFHGMINGELFSGSGVLIHFK